MSTLSVATTYEDGVLLYEADLDSIGNGVKTFINNGGITASNINAGAITGDLIKSLSVSTANIADTSIQASHIQSEAITTAKITAGQVTNVKLADESITTSKISGAMTIAKFAASNCQISAEESGDYLGSLSPNFSASVTITLTQDRPILLSIISGETDSYVKLSTVSTSTIASIILKVDISSHPYLTTVLYCPYTFKALDTDSYVYIPMTGLSSVLKPGVGTWTFTAYMYRVNTSTRVDVVNLKLAALEL